MTRPIPAESSATSNDQTGRSANSIYQRIGYRLAQETLRYEFGPVSG
ncbi:MAG: hypothetical protein O3B04_02520 [Chloroflexi bacterium]|nr:hypothetical protein [Chloroflexota bacterium]